MPRCFTALMDRYCKGATSYCPRPLILSSYPAHSVPICQLCSFFLKVAVKAIAKPKNDPESERQKVLMEVATLLMLQVHCRLLSAFMIGCCCNCCW